MLKGWARSSGLQRISRPSASPRCTRLRRLPLIRGRRVLVVDDNATNRTILMGQLLLCGVEPACASSADEALSLMHQAHAAHRPFDAALLDHQMPNCDGAELGRMIIQDDSLKIHASHSFDFIRTTRRRPIVCRHRIFGLFAQASDAARFDRLLDIGARLHGRLLAYAKPTDHHAACSAYPANSAERANFAGRRQRCESKSGVKAIGTAGLSRRGRRGRSGSRGGMAERSLRSDFDGLSNAEDGWLRGNT